MHNALLSCKTCGELFRKKSALKNHVKREHQSLVKVKFKNGKVTEVKKGVDGMFICKCEKSFKLPASLQTHAKQCNGEVPVTIRIEEEDMTMQEGDFDAPDSLPDLKESNTPMDCFGARTL
jgi:uncharacterized C2H2 Zn-finger protein